MLWEVAGLAAAVLVSLSVFLTLQLLWRRPRINQTEWRQRLQDVRWVYAALLNREPESETVERRWAEIGHTRERLLDEISKSLEFQQLPKELQAELLKRARMQLAPLRRA